MFYKNLMLKKIKILTILIIYPENPRSMVENTSRCAPRLNFCLYKYQITYTGNCGTCCFHWSWSLVFFQLFPVIFVIFSMWRVTFKYCYLWHTENYVVRLVPTIPLKLHTATNVVFLREQVKMYLKNAMLLKDK